MSRLITAAWDALVVRLWWGDRQPDPDPTIAQLVRENDALRAKIARQAQVINALRLVFDHFGFDVSIDEVEVRQEDDL